MSLRNRLLIVAALAGVALGIAIATVLRLSDASKSLGLDEAHRSNEAALARLAANHPTKDSARALAKEAVDPVPDTHGGYCWADGTIVEATSGGGGPPGPPPGMRGDRPPEPIREALASLCADGGEARVAFHGITRLEVRVLGDGVSAFAMRAVPSAETSGSPWLAALALLTVAIVAIAVFTLIPLRRSARVLNDAFDKLATDLRADIGKPSVSELASVAVGLRSLATRLADARVRERDLERQVAHTKRMASLGALVAGISHEIRNPLTGVKLVLDQIGRDGHRDEVDLALREVARLDKLVVSCLGVARDAEITRVDIDLGKLVDERIAIAGGRVTRTGTGTHAWDREALIRILDNLIRNAREASDDVEVVIARDQIDVVDRGAGVPDESKLFEPFVTSKADGTGLGLWMSLALAEARGGTIRYRRADGRTHFTLSLEGA